MLISHLKHLSCPQISSHDQISSPLNSDRGFLAASPAKSGSVHLTNNRFVMTDSEYEAILALHICE